MGGIYFGTVAVGILPAVEGARPAARKKGQEFPQAIENANPSRQPRLYFRRAGCPGSTAGEDAHRYKIL